MTTHKCVANFVLAAAWLLAATAAYAAAPHISISAPTDGAAYPTWSDIRFAASAFDNEDGDLTRQIVWSTEATGVFGTGGSVTTSLPRGEHEVFASVTDQQGTLSFDIVIVFVFGNGIPDVVINTPADGSEFEAGKPITLAATAFDFEDGDLTSNLSWSSSVDGWLGAGGQISAPLSVGAHVITASVTDQGGDTGTDYIVLFIVDDETPDVIIAAPLDGSEFEVGAAITFTGTAFDFEQGDLTDELTWTSNLDGVIGYGGSFSQVLTPGEHTIQAFVQDLGGVIGSDEILVFVNGNTTPTLQITQPGEGDAFLASEPITFAALATDFEDGDVSANVVWTSDRDGWLGTGATVVTYLSPGTHLITALITDNGGATTTRYVGLIVTSDCPADLDLDHAINLADFAILQAHFGQAGSPTTGDINFDNEVGLIDVDILLGVLGSVCP